MQRSLLAAAIVAALSASAYALPARAQDAQTGSTQRQDKTKPQELKKIIVTGSLIPTAEIETSTPVITITAQDIKKQGFTNLYQALRAQPIATGQVQGEQFAPGFTPGAQTISLLGLPPDFTLIMVDGHPLADYPLLYNGASSFTDVSSIPLAMISSVQIVPGNESSIYGSGAIAGVVNIILKHHAHGIDFDYRAGGYSDGGGASQRLQMVGGYNHKNFSLIYGLQYIDQQPIFAFQRPLTASTFSNPNPQLAGLPSEVDGIYDYNLGSFVDPNSIEPGACSNIGNQFNGTVTRFETKVPGAAPGTYVGSGQYTCGSPYVNGDTTLLNSSHSASGYLSAHFRLNQDAELYGTLLYDFSSELSYPGPDYNWWEPNINGVGGVSSGIIYNANTGTYQNPFEVFSPEETGSLAAGGTRFINRAYNFFGGIKGSLGQTDWNYDAFYARSQDNLVSNQPHPLTSKVDAFFQNQFLGPQLGTTGGPGVGYPIYAPNYSKFYQNLTPAQYQSFLGVIHSDSETYTQNANLEVTNSSLFNLPAGAVGFAGVLQAGDQKWTLPANPLVEAGGFWGETASSGGGVRNNYAAAAELHIPITSMLNADISARYDRFHNDGGGTNSKPTYKVAFSFRPFDTLLLRANYSTAFRMPDMGYVFIGPSGFYTTVTDYYQCELLHPGTPYSECSAYTTSPISAQIKGTQRGNAQLNAITAKSWGGGFVWSPTPNFNIKADYYNVRISNEVQYQSINSLLLDDAQCLLGQIPTTSPVCQTAFAAITRAGATGAVPYLLTGVTIEPINIAKENVDGVIASGSYRFDAGRWGEFTLSGQYNDTLKHTLQLAPGEPTYDLLHNPYYDYLSAQGGSAIGPEFKTILTGSLTWQINNWTTTATALRYGKLANLAEYSNPTQSQSYGAGKVAPWILYNFTVKYDISRDASVGLTINNVFNSMPPEDTSDTGWPYYDFGAYNPYGRSYFADFNYRF
ncbi:MAG: TonB-dependent receptor [Ferrovum sp.]|nr:TonB-dependent receptor [Ferrovum sp.]